MRTPRWADRTRRIGRSGIAAAAALLAVALIGGQTEAPQKLRPWGVAHAAEDDGTEEAPSLFAYQPPQRGAPAARVGGASRGAAAALEVLLPDHVARTVSDQPVLYWYVSQPIETPVQVTLIADGAREPLLSVRLDEPIPAGIQAFPIERYSVALAPDTVYEWSVSVLYDPQQPSLDSFARGEIRYVETPAGLPDRLSGQGMAETAALLARAGIWIDGLQALYDAVSAGVVPAAVLSDALEGQGLVRAARAARHGAG
jgi:hypothetical protein